MLDPSTTALVLIDMQWGFIDERSPLCVAGARATIPTCARALAAARRQGMMVVHAVRHYAADGLDVEAARYETWLAGRPLSSAADEGMDAGQPDELRPLPGEQVIVKPRYSAFFGTPLHEVLQEAGIETVALAGTTTPNCVRATCYDALSYDYGVVLLEDCISSQTEEIQQANVADMQRVGAVVVSCAGFEGGCRYSAPKAAPLLWVPVCRR